MSASVISGHLQCKTPCPLYPRKRTFCAPSAMSAAAMSRWPAAQARKRCIEAIKGSQAAT